MGEISLGSLKQYRTNMSSAGTNDPSDDWRRQNRMFPVYCTPWFLIQAQNCFLTLLQFTGQAAYRLQTVCCLFAAVTVTAGGFVFTGCQWRSCEHPNKVPTTSQGNLLRFSRKIHLWRMWRSQTDSLFRLVVGLLTEQEVVFLNISSFLFAEEETVHLT